MDRFIPYIQPGGYGITTELYRVDRNGEILSQVDPDSIGTMTIACSQDTNPKRSATVITDYPGDYTPFTDFLMPYLTISDPEGNRVSGPQGIYMVMPSQSVTAPNGRTGQVECRDLSQIFVMDAPASISVASGTDRGAAIRSMAMASGFVPGQIQIPDFDVMQVEDRVWEPGTSTMQAMTDLASGSNWYAPWFDNRGRLVTAPYRALTDIAPTWVYTNENDDDAADLESDIREDPDWNRLANRVTVRKIGTEEDPTISYTAENTNPDSPTSFQSLGVWLPTKIIDNPDLVDEEAARVQAENLLSESASHYRKLTLSTFPEVNADLHETVGLEITSGGELVFTGVFWRTGYSLVMDGSKTSFSQNLSRVESW